MRDPDPMKGRTKADRIREWATNADPARAAEWAAERFERDAIPVPAALAADASMPEWERRILGDAAEMYRSVVMAGERGLLLRELEPQMGAQRRADALKRLRAAGVVSERGERRPDSAGRTREQLVLRQAGL